MPNHKGSRFDYYDYIKNILDILESGDSTFTRILLNTDIHNMRARKLVDLLISRNLIDTIKPSSYTDYNKRFVVYRLTEKGHKLTRLFNNINKMLVWHNDRHT